MSESDGEMLRIVPLDDGWSFKQSDDNSKDAWMPVKKIPSTVHQDLIDNGRLEDPFVGFNELKAEWVGIKPWTYRKEITLHRLPPGTVAKAVLAFDGLDTFATVRLNGKKIYQSENMFLPFRVDVTADILAQDEHVLEVEFEPALLKAREIEKQHPEHKFICFNGETSRLAARKAQYHWGWDWGPYLMCCGIWKSVRLEVYTARIADVRIDMDIAKDYSVVTIKASIDIELSGKADHHDYSAVVQIRLGEEVVAGPGRLRVPVKGRVTTGLRINNPKLWMPTGYGEQNLYHVDVSLVNAAGIEHHHQSKRIGIRRIELVQEVDKHGKSFYFRINGIDIFCGGSCWIPADIFLTNITKERYQAWIELMVPANQKMIRVWGGGIYENDAFFDVCDELGIMVWQDFMFGCGNYPAFPSILDSIKAEATANVRRIRHHPSLVIFAGNNEDYQVQEQSGLTYNYEDKDEASWLRTDFPARFIYESLLPRVVTAECPSIPYHPGSPWGDGKPSSDPTVGDMHQWNVWHGTQEKYQLFDSIGGRFNSEFGMEAFPHVATIKTFVEKEEDMYPQSRVLDFHNKADGHERRIATYLVENVRTATQLEAYIHLTQLIQCEALMYGYRGWRKQWGDSRKCGGALVWQLNDCWPVTSWSICDYYLRRKPAYYAMARVLADINVGIRREHYNWSMAHAREPETQKWELWAVSSKLKEVIATVEVRFVSVKTGREIKDRLVYHDVKLVANGTTNIDCGVVDNINEEPHVLAARLWIGGHLVGRDTDWPQPLKYLHFPDRNVQIKLNGNDMHISVDRPVKCLVFEERQGCHLSDSAIDIVPGDDQTVTVRGLEFGDQPLSWTYLGAGEQ